MNNYPAAIFHEGAAVYKFLLSNYSCQSLLSALWSLLLTSDPFILISRTPGAQV